MKSQLFQEIQINYVPKMVSQVTQPYKRLKNIYSVQNNKKSHSKNMKSQNRQLNFSINNMQRKKEQTQKRQTKMAYYKPVQYIESIAQILPLSYQKDISKVYDQLKFQKQKQLKSIKMSNEQCLTLQKEKYIKMQKKFLLKQKEYIQLLESYSLLLKQFQYLQQEKQHIFQELNTQKDIQKRLIEQLKTLRQESSNKNQKNQNFHYFLRLLLQQTQTVINWAKIFELSSDDLPPMINMIKKDIEHRKFDLQVTLKEAANFEKLNFSNIQYKNDSKNNTFIEQQQYYSESFMKYLKQQSARSKIHSFKSTYPVDCSYLIQLDGNKQNLDFNSRSSINTLINDNKRGKNKNQHFSDQYLRILLLQAKTIEKSCQRKHSSLRKENNYQFQGVKCCQSENISMTIQ